LLALIRQAEAQEGENITTREEEQKDAGYVEKKDHSQKTKKD